MRDDRPMDPEKDSPLNQQSDSQWTVHLNLIDKMYTTLTKQWDSFSRVVILQVLISLIALSICGGVITPKENFSLLGIDLTISLPALLAASSVLITAFVVMSYALLARIAALKEGILASYEEVGLYQDEGYMNRTFTMPSSASPRSPFEQPGVLFALLRLGFGRYFAAAHWGVETSQFARIFETAATVFVLTFYMILPIAAEMAVLLKVPLLMEWRENLGWILLVLPIVVSIATVIWGAFYSQSLFR